MGLDRREFIKCTAAAGVCLGLGAVMPARAEGRLRDPADMSGAGGVIRALDSTRRSILYHAALAPSGHNSQPWRVRVESADQWVIEADPERRLPAVDQENRELLLSLGAFAENLLLAAGASGYAGETQVIAKNRTDREVLLVRLHKDRATSYPVRRLAARMTAKQGYRSDEIKPADIEAFRRETGGGLFYFPKGSDHAECIREAAVTCFRIQTGRDEAQQEFVRWLRLKDGDVDRQRDGLTVKGMGIDGVKGWFLRHFVRPEDFMKPRYRQQSIESVVRSAKEGGGWLVITSHDHEVTDLIEAGRRFERMALLARDLGIGLHPMTQILEEKQGLEQVSSHHGGGMIPQFVLRVGYLERYPEPVSPRRPVGWFTYQ